MPYMMGGFPDRGAADAIADAYADAGADLIELGVPFSDPLADGPGDPRRRDAGARRRRDARGRARDLRPRRRPRPGRADGLREHASSPRARARSRGGSPTPAPRARSSPTCRPRRAPRSAPRSRTRGLALVPLVAPTTPARAPAADLLEARAGSSTSSRSPASPASAASCRPSSRELVAAVREDADVPVAVGFGIGTPEQAAAVGEIADGVIIGSRLVREVGEARAPRRPPTRSRRSCAACRRRDGSERIDSAPCSCSSSPSSALVAFWSPTPSASAARSAALIFLAILFTGAVLRVAEPLIERAQALAAAQPNSGAERLVVLERDGPQLARRPRRAAPARSAVPCSAAILPQSPVVGGVDRREAEAGREHAVAGGRGAAALDVAEHRGAGLEPGPRLDLALEPVPDPAEARVAELVELSSGRERLPRPRSASRPRRRRRSRSRARAPCGGRSRAQTSSMSNGRSGIRITSAPPATPGLERDPAGVAAHHLDDEDPVVALGRRVQAVDRLGGDRGARCRSRT